MSSYLRENCYNPPPSLLWSCGGCAAPSPHPPSLYPSISHSQQPWMLQMITLIFYCSLSGVSEFYTDLTCAENLSTRKQTFWGMLASLCVCGASGLGLGQFESTSTTPPTSYESEMWLHLRSFYRLWSDQKSEDLSPFKGFFLPCFACLLQLQLLHNIVCFQQVSFAHLL